MVRFVLSADWHLGAGFPGRQNADELRRLRLQTARNVLAIAQNKSADFAIVAGDLFDSNRAGRGLMYEAREILRTSSMPVYILPGNHDSLEEDSVYRVRAEMNDLPGHVRVLTEQTPVTLSGVTLYPCPCFGKVSSQDPTSWIPARSTEDGIRIGIAHGSWKVMPDLPEDDHPIPKDAALLRGLDVLCLGHWHSLFPRDVSSGSERTFYPGTPEQLSYAEKGAGNVLLVTIESVGALPRVEPIRSGKMRFLQHSIELRGQDAVHEVRHTLEQIDEPDSCLVRLVLTGVLNPVASGRLQQTLAELEPRFFGFEIDSSHLLSLPDELSHEVLDSRLMKQVASRLAEYARSENLTPPSESSFGARLPEELAGGETLCNAGSRALELLFGQVRLGVRNRVGDNK